MYIESNFVVNRIELAIDFFFQFFIGSKGDQSDILGIGKRDFEKTQTINSIHFETIFIFALPLRCLHLFHSIFMLFTQSAVAYNFF